MIQSSPNLLSGLKKAIIDRWFLPEQLLALADTDEDGRISHAELLSFMKSFNLVSANDEIVRTIFATFDHNNDGFIDLSELSSALTGLPFALDKNISLTAKEKPEKSVSANSKYVSLVAHNEMKEVLISFVSSNSNFFSNLPLVTTGTTGRSLKNKLDIHVEKLVASGPLGGDQAIGGLISEGRISAIFFFKDPLSSHAHASDIEALTRLCDVHQIPYATNAASAQGLIMSLAEFGLDWDIHKEESLIVKKYKNVQQNVVNSHDKK